MTDGSASIGHWGWDGIDTVAERTTPGSEPPRTGRSSRQIAHIHREARADPIRVVTGAEEARKEEARMDPKQFDAWSQALAIGVSRPVCPSIARVWERWPAV